jgi:hypothetical protein
MRGILQNTVYCFNRAMKNVRKEVYKPFATTANYCSLKNLFFACTAENFNYS